MTHWREPSREPPIDDRVLVGWVTALAIVTFLVIWIVTS